MTRCTVTGEEPTNEPGAPVPNDAKREDGQHVDHWTMCPGEILRAGFKRPVRDSYVHVGIAGPNPKNTLRTLTDEERQLYPEYAAYEVKGGPPGPKGRYWTQQALDSVGKGCGTKTSMPKLIAETYAAEPGYYGSTFCTGCGKYLPVGEQGEFVWSGTQDRVGT